MASFHGSTRLMPFCVAKFGPGLTGCVLTTSLACHLTLCLEYSCASPGHCTQPHRHAREAQPPPTCISHHKTTTMCRGSYCPPSRNLCPDRNSLYSTDSQPVPIKLPSALCCALTSKSASPCSIHVGLRHRAGAHTSLEHHS